MPTFAYKARSATGDVVNGTLIADTQAAAARVLDERDLLPVHVDEVSANKRSFLTGGARRVSLSKVGIVYEQLSDLLRSGVPLLRAMDVIIKQTRHPTLSRVLREVRDDVAGGDTLANAMTKHPHAFPLLHTSAVRAGEAGGFLEDVLARLSNFVERQDVLRNKFIGSMIYPCILLVGALAAVIVLMTFVVPNIRPMLEGRELPWPTIVVFFISDVFEKQLVIVAGILLLATICLIGFFQSAVGKRIWSRVQLHAPVLGRIYTMISICRFCRIFGTMLANGVPILQALQISKDSMGNPILEASIESAAENVRHGEPLAGPLSKSGVFPPAIVDMIAVAEESNTLEKVLVEIADTQEARTARQVDLMVRMLEPAMLVLMAGMVGFIAIALLLPIMRMATSGLKQ